LEFKVLGFSVLGLGSSVLRVERIEERESNRKPLMNALRIEGFALSWYFGFSF